MNGRYGLGTAPPARGALAERLPANVAAAAAVFVTGPLLDNPHRLGQALGEKLAGIYSARLARDWRVLYEIDATKTKGCQVERARLLKAVDVLAVDRSMGQDAGAVPQNPRGDWRAVLRTSAMQFPSVILRHPGITDVPAVPAKPPSGTSPFPTASG